MEVGSEGAGLGLILLTLMVLGVTSIIVIRALITRQHDVVKKIIMGMIAWVGVYFIILLTVSLTSQAKVLGIGEEKRFCGFYLDCHLAVSVIEVEKTKTIETQPNLKEAAGTYYIVRVKVSSDAIGATLNFANPIATVIDEDGREYGRWVSY